MAGREKEGELATASQEFEYLHRKSRCEILISGDEISNDVITLGTWFSMFVYIRARLHFALIGWDMTAQTLLQTPLPFPSPTPESPEELARRLWNWHKSTNWGHCFFYLVLETGLPFCVVIRVAQRFSHLQARAKAVPLFLSPAPGIKVTISRSAPTSTLLAELFIFCFLIILFPFGLYRFILTTGLLQPREVLSENVFLVLQPTISYNWCSSIQYVRVSFRKQFSGL